MIYLRKFPRSRFATPRGSSVGTSKQLKTNSFLPHFRSGVAQAGLPQKRAICRLTI
jgi:hypothetical protein